MRDAIGLNRGKSPTVSLGILHELDSDSEPRESNRKMVSINFK